MRTRTEHARVADEHRDDLVQLTRAALLDAQALLELVEDQPAAAAALAVCAERLEERPRAVGCRRLGGAAVAGGERSDLRGQPCDRIPAPVVEDDDGRARLAVVWIAGGVLLAQPVHDARAQQRALADAAVSVEHRQARRAEVRDDEIALGRAAEEAGRLVVVAVGGQAGIGRRSIRGARSPRRTPS